MKRNEKPLSPFERYKQGFADWPPFPLPDKYDPDDPELVSAAFGAIRRVRWTYTPELPFFGEQLKAATEVALDIRLAWSSPAHGLYLPEVPLSKNPDWPTEQDFIRLEQWFLDAGIAIAKKIARGSETATKEQRRSKSALAWIVALGVLVVLVLAFEAVVYWLPWNWLKNHPNSYGLQPAFCVAIFLLGIGAINFFWGRKNKIFWGVWGALFATALGAIFFQLGGPSRP